MNAALVLTLFLQTYDQTYDQEKPQERRSGSLPLMAGQLDLHYLRTEWDGDFDLKNFEGYGAELQLRLDDMYYYKIGASTLETETEDLGPNQDVDVGSALVGLGMDFTFEGLKHFSLDIGAGIGLTRYSSSVDSDTGWFYQFDFVARIRPIRAVALRIGVQIDTVYTSFRTGDESDTDVFRNYNGLIGLEINF